MLKGGVDCNGWSSDLVNVFATSGRVNEAQFWTDIGYGNQRAYQTHLFCFSEVENGPVLFFDGFESSDTGEWSATVP